MAITTTQKLTGAPTATTYPEVGGGSFAVHKLAVADYTPFEAGGQVLITEGATSETVITIDKDGSGIFVEQLVNTYTSAAYITSLGRTNPGNPLGQTLVKNSSTVYVNGSKNKAETFWNQLAKDIKAIAIDAFTFLQIPTLPNTDPTNANHATRKSYVDSTVDASFMRSVKRIRGTACPNNTTATTIVVAHIAENNQDLTRYIEKNASTTLDIATTGLNGIALASTNLSALITVSSGSAAVTLSASVGSNLQIGDTITTAGGQCRKLISGSGTSWTAESAFTSSEVLATVKRGGRAKNTMYYVYAIDDGTTPGLIASTRNVAAGHTLVDLPSASYTHYRQLPYYFLTTNSADIHPHIVADGWPTRPKIILKTPITLINVGGLTTFTTVNCNFAIPGIARAFDADSNVSVSGNTASNSTAAVRETGNSASERNVGWGAAATSGDYVLNASNGTNFLCNASQQIDYKVGLSGQTLTFTLTAVYITEVQ